MGGSGTSEGGFGLFLFCFVFVFSAISPVPEIVTGHQGTTLAKVVK